MNLPKELLRLAEIFSGSATLFLVGGSVRNAVLGLPVSDYDICSALTPNAAEQLLAGHGFYISAEYKRFGTLLISAEDGSRFEYTAFRKDSYRKDGTHRPKKVQFCTDLIEDAKRRDFTANAVYYDIAEKTYVDPLGGLNDIQNKRIRAAAAPTKVFSEDALRILRMVRFSAELGFEIEAQTREAAASCADGLISLKPERISEELNKILTADLRYGMEGAHTKGLYLLKELGVYERILPELAAGADCLQNPTYHRYDVLTHNLECARFAPPKIRLAALLHDVGKPFALAETGSMRAHDVIGSRIAYERLAHGLKYPKAVCEEVKQLILHHMFDLTGDESDASIRQFIAKNHAFIEKLIALKRADYRASGEGLEGRSGSAERLAAMLQSMQELGLPFGIKDLKIGGNDLLKAGIPERQIGRLLDTVLKTVLIEGKTASKKEQLQIAMQYSGR